MIKSDEIYYVYKLIDERNNLPFYIGKGKNNRAISHISRAKKWKEKNFNWSTNVNRKLYNKILSILDDGFDIKVIYVEKNLEETLALETEKQLISEIGIENLCNLTEGGEGESRTEEILQKMSLQRKEWLKTEEGKKFILTLSEQRKGNGNPRWKFKEDEEKKRERMKNMLSKPRWNAGLTKENDSRIVKLAPWKGKIPPNAKKIEIFDIATQTTLTFLSITQFRRYIKNTIGKCNSKYVYKLLKGEINVYIQWKLVT